MIGGKRFIVPLVALLSMLLFVPENEAARPRRLTVFAASSLTDAFRAVGRRFTVEHPGTEVRFNFGASNLLAFQIAEGAAADVYAAAAAAPMMNLYRGGQIIDTPRVFAGNRLVVITPPANPARLRSWTEVARPGVKLVLAAPGVPAGDYAREILRRTGLERRAARNLVSNEPNVRAVVGKVAMGEADAGIVYASDARAERRVVVLAIPDSANVTVDCPISVARTARDRVLARQFIEFVCGPVGQSLLKSHGFITN